MTEQPPRRERVVLSQRRNARMMRTRVEVQEQTEVGDALVRGLMRAQLGIALRLAAAVIVVIVAIPLTGTVFPWLTSVEILGVRLNWLVLVFALYPLLYVAGRIYVHFAEQAERDFLRVVDDETDHE
ncbi:hypothetical protein VX037_05345 [Gordonia sp. Z-3]|uniref:DUF485 domain-containing protein n=1 Tax=Gordonia aquimaris TaxID=2984863 RepID=A0A9X3D3U0_9ACTN|nr:MULTISPECIES: hypothetical protein [Gordonia]MCX2963256.1 hypothetical protein [Gordonia aquimaris]MED5800450.1 hypothetical protein [Gordonia sp. Z-3]